MVSRLQSGDLPAAAAAAQHVAEADRLNAQTAADTAKICAQAAPLADSPQERAGLARSAIRWADEAVRRDPANYAFHRLLGNILWFSDASAEAPRAKALKHIERAVELNPMDMRLRIECAGMLLGAGRGAQSLVHLDHALVVNASLDEFSDVKLTDKELSRIETLRTKAGQR